MKLIIAILAASLFLAMPCQARSDLANGIKAIVDDAVITYDELEMETGLTAEPILRRHGNQPEILDKRMAELREENLQKLLSRQLILHDWKTSGFNLPESVVDELVQERIRNRFGDRVHLTKTL